MKKLPIFNCPLCDCEPSYVLPPIIVGFVHSEKPIVFEDWFQVADYIKQREVAGLISAISCWEYQT